MPPIVRYTFGIELMDLIPSDLGDAYRTTRMPRMIWYAMTAAVILCVIAVASFFFLKRGEISQGTDINSQNVIAEQPPTEDRKREILDGLNGAGATATTSVGAQSNVSTQQADREDANAAAKLKALDSLNAH